MKVNTRINAKAKVKYSGKRYLFTMIYSLIFSVCGFSSMLQAAEKSPLRIIALAPHIVENLYAVGAGDLIVGTTEHADYPESAKTIPRIGNYARLNIEEILAKSPDVVIAWQTGNPSDDLAKLKKLGINIIYSQPNEIEDVAKELLSFGVLTNNAALGEKKSQQFLAELKTIKETYQDKSPIIVFFELWPQPLTTTANNSWSQQQLNVCQVINPFIESATDYPQVNLEDVVLKAPKIIIQPSSHGINAPDRVNWQQWPDMPAVKNKAFIHTNADKLHRMTARSLEELASLCQKIDQFRR